jgi:hypothetical protein
VKITFSDDVTHNSKIDVYDFTASVDGEKVACRVTESALLRLDAGKNRDSNESLFQDHAQRVQQIASRMIHEGRVRDGRLTILFADIDAG